MSVKFVAIILGGVAVCAGARADWTYSIVNPAGQASAGAYQIGANVLVGFQGPLSAPHATVWNGYNPASAVDMNPPGASSSNITNLGGGQYVGNAVVSGVRKAMLWKSDGSIVSLHPSGYSLSYANSTDGTHQAGFGDLSNGIEHALFWSGTAASATVLDPAGVNQARIYGMGGGREVGSVNYPPPQPTYRQAGFWSGTAASFVLLSAPAGYDQSEAIAISPDGLTQGGYASGSLAPPYGTAALWHGTTDSFVPLNPAGYLGSGIGAMDARYEVGSVNANAGPRAAFWAGTAASFVNLSDVLPANYTTADAFGVYSTESDVWVAGYAFNTNTSFYEAVLWHEAVPEPGTAALMLIGVARLSRRRLIRELMNLPAAVS